MWPDDKTLVKMYDGGLTSRQIAEQIGENFYTVWQHIRAAGAKMRPSGRPRKLPPARELRRLYVAEGMSSLKIANMFGCSSHKPVIAALERAGIPIRKSGPRKQDHCCKCWRPIQRVFHKRFRCWYGTMCKLHRTLHRVERARWYTRERRRIHWKKWRYQSDVPEATKNTAEYQLFLDIQREEQCLKEAKMDLKQVNQFLRQQGRCHWPSAGL